MDSEQQCPAVAATPDSRPPVTSRRGFFWVGTEPEPLPDGGSGVRGAMYVHWEAAPTVRHRLPVVLVHGGGGQGLDYFGTPDGRPGWVPMLVEQGHMVYVVDRPGHGRSPYDPSCLGPMAPALPEPFLAELFAPATDGSSPNPLAPDHTQWAGGRSLADPVLRHVFASSGPMAADTADAQALDGRRLAQLLDRIGPAIVITHSAGGPAGWVAADLRPDLVAAIVAIEPVGPPFNEVFGPGSFAWGPASAPLTYDPPAASPEDLSLVRSAPAADGAPVRVVQAKPARRLPRLAGVPIAVVTGSASPFASIDPITVEVLRQAGCDVDHVVLAERGITGNGHAMMFEKNNAEVLDVVIEWALEHTGD
ncbi:alpha/beta fold hydrolase [Streptomyces tuirus]|uniref:Alpha/beta fold hydrolase n=1 Tax=Streptomyces tuirus TaxID=68278 RepID=A0A941FD21_9ACTN|nr:alpha/beta fold hydrolase [Streptomyces tuirus]